MEDSTPEDCMERQHWMMLKYKRFHRLWICPFLATVIVYHPDTVKLLLKTSAPKPRTGAYEFALPWLGQGLLIARGQRWARSRRLLTPAFHFDILKPYMEVYNKTVEVLLSKLERFADSGDSFEVFSNVGLCTLEVILKCAMSYDDDIQLTGESHPYVVAVSELSDLISQRGRCVRRLVPSPCFAASRVCPNRVSESAT